MVGDCRHINNDMLGNSLAIFNDGTCHGSIVINFNIYELMLTALLIIKEWGWKWTGGCKKFRKSI